MINRRNLVAASAATVAAVSIATRSGAAQLSETDLPLQNASFIVSANSATPESSPAATPMATPHMSTDVTGYVLGDPDAAHTLTVYADYRCPHCRNFSKEIEPQIIEEYVETGKLNIEFLDFTVIGVPSFDDLDDDSIESVQAAEAAACAAEQDAYLAYRDWLFDGPTRTSEGDFADDNLIAAADALGLDVDQFSESLSTGKYEQAIMSSVSFGLDHGVQGTPAMTLDGGEAFYLPENGFEGLKEMLDSLLD